MKPVLLSFCTLIFLQMAGPSYAQVFDDPTTTNSNFTLPLPTGFSPVFPTVPNTVNIGDIDPNVLSAFDNALLNDVVVLGPLFNTGPVAPAGEITGRAPIWTIVHNDPVNTRSLELLPRLEIPFGGQTFYTQPSTVEILDLNLDGQNDIAFMSSLPGFSGNKTTAIPGSVFGLEGLSSSPFIDVDTLTLLGFQMDANIPSTNSTFDASQPALTVGDFTSSGRGDLAFYDFGNDPPTDLIRVKENDGSFALLPSIVSIINGPIDPPNNLGISITSGDFDDNGRVDTALTFNRIGEGMADALVVYPGNGDGTFSADPSVNVPLTIQDDVLHGLVAGEFDGDGHWDFAVSNNSTDVPSLFPPSELYIVLCNSDNPPPDCSLLEIDVPEFVQNLAAADFNGDGLDDLAVTRNRCALQANCFSGFIGEIGVYLNPGDGNFSATPDQILTLEASREVRMIQVVADEIDGCGGPDLAYIGGFFQPPPNLTLDAKTIVKQGNGPLPTTFYSSVAFNANEDPVANAGSPIETPAGIQIGGTAADPTCSDPTGDALNIQWEQTAGNPATLNDGNAANPVVSDVNGAVTFQVTCTDACGAQSLDTVTIPSGAAPNLLFFGDGCNLHPGAPISSAYGWWWMLAIGIIGMRRFFA